jgi:hypothetical protein
MHKVLLRCKRRVRIQRKSNRINEAIFFCARVPAAMGSQEAVDDTYANVVPTLAGSTNWYCRKYFFRCTTPVQVDETRRAGSAASMLVPQQSGPQSVAIDIFIYRMWRRPLARTGGPNAANRRELRDPRRHQEQRQGLHV